MKKTKIILLSVFLYFIIHEAKSQGYNWNKLDSTKYILTMKTGIEYGIFYGVSFHNPIKFKTISMIPYADLTLPMGSKILDDFKLKAGVNFKLFQRKNLIISMDVNVIDRQNKNPFVRMHNIGSESGFTVGYYKPKWYIGIGLTSDNILISHLKHTEAYKGNYSLVKDAWYSNTSTNLIPKIGLGYHLKQSEIHLNVGQIYTQGFREKVLLPYFIQLGFNYKINK